MVEPGKTSVMRQKAGQGRPPPEIPPLTAQRALENALVFAADATEGLVVTPQDVVEMRMLLSSFDEDLSGLDFLSVVEGPQSAFGVIAADLDLVTALIQIQTTGMLSAQPATERPITQTDAAMCADFFDRVLERFEQDLIRAGVANAMNLSGYRFAFHVGDLRAMRLALADIPYRAFRLRFALGDKGREGSVVLAFPFDGPVQHSIAGQKRLSDQTHAPAEVVMEAQADLAAVLYRKRMSLHELCQITPGQVLTIPKEALGSVWLEDLTGQKLATCRLGQARGMRALRIGAAQAGDAAGDVLALGAMGEAVGDPLGDAAPLGLADGSLDLQMPDPEGEMAPMEFDTPLPDLPDGAEPVMDFPEVDLSVDLPVDLPEVDFDVEPLCD